jgi:hypothetical protein
MALTLPVGSAIYLDETYGLDAHIWKKVSEHNRAPVVVDTTRIEKSQRMANGTLRKIFIADKVLISTTWSDLPSSSTMTVDGGWGAMDLKTYYENQGKGAFWVKLSPNGTSAREKIVKMAFVAASFSMMKRNVRMGSTTSSAQISAATPGTTSIVYTADNSFQAGNTVTIRGFESSQFNVTNAVISAATATTFTVPKQKDLSCSITQVSASGGVITYIANNTFSVGDRITITGLATTAFNLTDVKIVAAADSYFDVSNAATGAAVTSAAGGTATVIGESTVFAISKTEPSLANKDIKFTSAAHKIHAGETVNITSVRPDATITNVTAHTTAGQVKYTAANSFAAGDYISISGITPSQYNVQSAAIVSATETDFIIAIAATGTFRKSGTASSILNVKNALVKSVTSDTFTVESLTANGLAITSTASAQQVPSYPASAVSVSSEVQEFWDVSITLEEV